VKLSSMRDPVCHKNKVFMASYLRFFVSFSFALADKSAEANKTINEGKSLDADCFLSYFILLLSFFLLAAL